MQLCKISVLNFRCILLKMHSAWTYIKDLILNLVITTKPTRFLILFVIVALLLTGMCVQVFSEMCALFEPLSAHCAWVPPVAAVDAKDVCLDVGVSGE